MKKWLYLFIVFLSVACSEEPNIVESDISSKTFGIKRDQAIQISKYFWLTDLAKTQPRSNQANARVARVEKEIEKVTEFKGNDKNTIVFIVNYKNSAGFTLISADKRVIPVLAYADEGFFDEKTDNPGVQFWLETLKDVFDKTKKISKVADDVEQAWKRFERNDTRNKRISSIEDCGPTPNNVFVQHLTDNLSRWGQGTGYNYHCPQRSGNSCSCGNAAVGCGPVAMGQVLRYHNKQVYINNTVFTQSDFNNMPVSLPGTCYLSGSTNLSVAWLLRSLGDALDVSYFTATNCQTAVLSPSNIVSLFNQIGYNSYELHFYNNVQFVENEISNNRPVILYGSNCDACFWNAHIWVLDGVQKSYWYDAITRYDDYGNTWEECILNSWVTYQMNWGWNGGSNNQWYTLYGFNGAGTIYNNSNMKAYIVNP